MSAISAQRIAASVGNSMSIMGEWDWGVPRARQAIQMTPKNYAKWWWWVIAKNHWRKGEYEEALDAFKRAYIEKFWLSQLMLAYTYPFLNRVEDSNKATERLAKLKPGFTVADAEAYYRMWCFDDAYIDKMKDALRRAGLPE